MTLKITVKVIWRHLVNELVKTIMMYHHTKFELTNAFHKNYMNVQICIMSTFISINIVHLFRQTNPENAIIEISIKKAKNGNNAYLFA